MEDKVLTFDIEAYNSGWQDAAENSVLVFTEGSRIAAAKFNPLVAISTPTTRLTLGPVDGSILRIDDVDGNLMVQVNADGSIESDESIKMDHAAKAFWDAIAAAFPGYVHSTPNNAVEWQYVDISLIELPETANDSYDRAMKVIR
jgi:hypothetical protein